MAEHERFIKKIAARPVVHIKKDLVPLKEASRITKSTKYANAPCIWSVRYEYCTIEGRKIKCHRVFVMAADSGNYHKLGWIANDDMDRCMVCHYKFYDQLTSGKHHCRACGNIVCDTCSKGRAVVREISLLGPIRVCNQCYFGQEIVDAHCNDQVGEALQASTSLEVSRDEVTNDDDYDEGSISALNLWDYGEVKLLPIAPCFVIRTRRSNRSRVYINVCSCEAVPYNSDIMAEGKRVVFMVCGSMGITVEEKCTVYDVAVNPREFEGLDHYSQEGIDKKADLCVQLLVSVSSLTPERDFFSYQWEEDVVYKAREKKQSRKEVDASPGKTQFPALAIPSHSAFKDLLQCSTRLEDVADGGGSKNSSSTPATKKAGADNHRERLLRAISKRSASQTRVDNLATEEMQRQVTNTHLTPYPGFVVKTRKTGDPLKKVFVNVYHHEDVDRFLLESNATLGDHEPRVLVGELTDVSDKEGIISCLYHVVVASKFFLESYYDSRLKITDAFCIRKILNAVTTRHQEELDMENYALPRIKGGFKGGWIADEMMFAYMRPRSNISEAPIDIPAASSIQSVAIPTDPIVQTLSNRNLLSVDEVRGARDNDSVISELTTATDATGFSMRRKSITDLFYPQKHRSISKSQALTVPLADKMAGVDLVRADMLTLDRAHNIDLKAALQLKQQSVSDPMTLLGWQVTLFDKNNKSDVFVITGARKNHLRKVEYRLTSLAKGDLWVRLKRSEKKTGTPFTINHKVLLSALPSAI